VRVTDKRIQEVRIIDKSIQEVCIIDKSTPEVGMIDTECRVTRLYRLYTNMCDRQWRCYVCASGEGFLGKKCEIYSLQNRVDCLRLARSCVVDGGATEEGVTDKGVPDGRMNDIGVAETHVTYTVSSAFVSLFFTPPHWKGHSHFKFMNVTT